jgi:flagellar M-ring protein FliF
MALVNAESANATFQGLNRLPFVRQLSLMVGLALSIAIGVSVVMWSQQPNYQMLYGSLAEKDITAVMDALQKANIDYKMDHTTGAIMVPAGKVHDARLKLATQGLPKGTGAGFEIMENQQGFGTSQFMEAARYQHALEGELARSIGTLNTVQSARVHLALPKQSVFVRNRQQPSASVLVNLFSGRNLDDAQVAGIVHLVAASIPNLDPARVTVVDQKGRLLNSEDSSRELALSKSQFEYANRVEKTYVDRVEDLLMPIVGPGRVKAQVVAELDFTFREQTQESYNADKPALRSEQTTEEQSVGYAGANGIPGALTNQPPGATTVPEQATATSTSADAASTTSQTAATPPSSRSKRATQNYELDKTISHTRQPSGSVRRLSVAVVLDDKQTINDDGEVVRAAYSKEELDRFTGLVKDAVGFDEARGDSVSVLNVAFSQPEPAAPLPEPPLLEQPWLWDVAKQVGGVILVLILAFGVLRPVLRSLAEKGRQEPEVMFAGGQAALPGGEQLGLAAPEEEAAPKASDYETDLNTTRTMVQQDPKRVAQVVKTWVATDGNS